MSRTRFAPSPTGHLHIGGARTALFCWLHARKTQGQYLVRIEDTDRERSTQAAIDTILDSLKWLDLVPDENIIFQTQRFDRYQELADGLLKSGQAYRCYCDKDRLANLREEQIAAKQKPKYDGHCRNLNRNDLDAPHVIRFKNPQEGEVVFEDLVRGTIKISNQELDDVIIYRSDGTPTYNFSVVVDDMDMDISHVIRGEDHINNTPRQINIYHALDAMPPVFAHVPMILGQDGQKLSKRHGALSVMEYQKQGILPQALINYLVRLGWSHGDQEVFSTEELFEHFAIEDVNKAAAKFDSTKLLWLNQHYIKNSTPTELAKHLLPLLNGLDVSNGPQIEAVIEAHQERAKTLLDIIDNSHYFYSDDIKYNQEAVDKHLTPEVLPIIGKVLEQLKALDSWESSEIYQTIVDCAKAHDLTMGKLAQPIRVATTGDTASPSLGITLELIGKERVCSRLESVLNQS